MVSRRGRLAAWLPCVLALAAGLAAASPLAQPGFFEGHDGIQHLFRVAVLADELRRGVLYPRWAGDLALGYGYPVFHFYGPLAHYLAWAFSQLGLALPEASKAVSALALVGVALGTYLLARDVLAPAGRWAAALAAAAAALAPYVLDATYVRGAFGEAVSFALYPPLLWGVRRLVRDGRALPGWAVTSGATALAVVTYNPLALFGLPLAAGYALWMVGPRSGRALARVVGGLALGLGLAAWFWLPALLDQRLVTIANLGYARENLLPLTALVQPALRYQHHQFPFGLGMVQVLLAGLGCLGVLRLPAAARREVLFFPLAGLGGALLISTLALPFWEELPFLALIAYPWRLLGLLAVLFALPTGGLLLLVPDWVRPLVSTVLVVVLAWANLNPTLPEPILLNAREITPAGWQRREQQLGRIGTTTGAEYLPRWSERGPGAAEDVPRAEGAPAVEAARLVSVSGLDLVLDVMTTAPFTLRLHRFAFPGWEARVNGQPVAVRPETALGLVSLSLPAGTSRVELRFGMTPSVIAGGSVTIAVLLALLVVGLGRRRWSVVLLAGLMLAVALAALGWRPPVRVPAGAGIALAPEVWLLGATVDPVGEGLALRLYWLASRPPERDYRVVLTLSDATGQVVVRREAPPRYGLEPTSEWRANEVIADPIWFRLPAPRPAGQYTLTLALTGQPAQAGVGWPAVPLATLMLPAATAPPAPPPLAVFSDQLALEAASLQAAGTPPAGPVAPGTPFELQLRWRALRVPEEDYVFFLHLYGTDGRRWLQVDRRPGGGVSALTTWEPGEAVDDVVRGVLPLDLPAGVYRLAIGWYEPGGGPRLPVGAGDTFTLAQLVVVRPVAPPAHAVGAVFGGWAQLAGWEVDRAHGSLRLVWRAVRPAPGAFHVFVHVVDAAGRILAQSDGPPAGGAFPTTAWPLEVALDDWHRLPTLAGRLRVGLYDPQSGARLLLANGADALDLAD
ncbi:MAG: hypothetical protein K6U89_08565 [Chloroflexi bacterium]|nr:hypothetical protein [Chloroflexota bacterium]